MDSEAKYKVVLGVSGCIAAYKACEILRGLQKAGCDVQVVMSDAATKFVGPATFRALSGHDVGLSLFEDGSAIPHISFGQNCDLFLIAPATANVMAKIANGIADDLLTSVALACTSPILVAPAMNVHMYENAATQANMRVLKSRGIHVLDASYGRLACGDVGKGKLAFVEEIVAAGLELLGAQAGEVGKVEGKAEGKAELSNKSEVLAEKLLIGKSILITSGPTVEPIDPVRFLSNKSSGKMGAALAFAACDSGAKVTVISGPVQATYPQDAEVISVSSASEMHNETIKRAKDFDVVICAAAVADFKPEKVEGKKIKKNKKKHLQINLVENPDILAEVVERRQAGQVIVGFAAETDNLIENGRKKLLKKKADIIVCNEVGEDKCFGQDENAGWIITTDGETEIPLTSKQHMAEIILAKIAIMLT